MIKYCVSLCCNDISSLISKLKDVKDKTDFIEIRIDKFKKFDLELLRQFDIKRMILTLRSKTNGGFYTGSEESRINILKNLLNFGFGFIDIEYDIPKQDLKWFLENKKSTKVILSFHNFNKLQSSGI